MTEKERAAAFARARLREKDPQEIERKKREAEAARLAREQFHLEEERRKYGITRKQIPLSRMPI